MSVGLISNVIRALSILLSIAGAALSVPMLQGNVPLMILLLVGCVLLLVMGLALAHCLDAAGFLDQQRQALSRRLSEVELELRDLRERK